MSQNAPSPSRIGARRSYGLAVHTRQTHAGYLSNSQAPSKLFFDLFSMMTRSFRIVAPYPVQREPCDTNSLLHPLAVTNNPCARHGRATAARHDLLSTDRCHLAGAHAPPHKRCTAYDLPISSFPTLDSLSTLKAPSERGNLARPGNGPDEAAKRYPGGRIMQDLSLPSDDAKAQDAP